MNGLIFNFYNKAAYEAETLAPAVQTLNSLVNSIYPLLILVEIDKAWKKEI